MKVLKDKFTFAIKAELPLYFSCFNEVQRLILGLGKRIHNLEIEDDFIRSSLNIAQISNEWADSIFLLINYGFIVEALSLVRCHLELSHLLVYLKENPDKFVKWLNPDKKDWKDFRPETIGKYFESKKYIPQREFYEELSNYVHFTSDYVNSQHSFNRRAPISNFHKIAIAQALYNTILDSAKICSILLSILTEYSEGNSEILRQFDDFKKNFDQLNRTYQNDAKKYLKD
jgi:hypothetical protein